MAANANAAKVKPKKHGGGFPTLYRSWYPDLATWMRRNGLTLEELALEFKVSAPTLRVWANKHPTFAAALEESRDLADSRVADSLYQRACEGNITACIFWLKNRRPGDWRDVQRSEITHLTVRTLEEELERLEREVSHV